MTSTGNKRLYGCALVLFCCVAVIYIASSNLLRAEIGRNVIHTRLELSTEVERNGGEKIILLWTTFFETADFYFGLGSEPFHRAKCSVNNCLTTTDKSMLGGSHAVVFHIRDIKLDLLPSFRTPAQRWVYFLMESPENSPREVVDALNDSFNWTMTYRQDSDIFHPYGQFVKTRRNVTELDGIIKRKNKNVAWFVSHCPTPSKREDYAEELSKHIQVDIYGSCGTLSCVGKESCRLMLRDNYRFYLAFENSLCRDYVTEKFWTALEYHIVPIVYGGANYSAFAPPRSFINSRDFSSPKDLAEYLHYLSRNETAYREYFEWRKEYRISYPQTGWCNLCSMLNNATLPHKSYTDMHRWWVDESHCAPFKM